MSKTLEALEPYKVEGNKYYFKHNNEEMILERIKANHYKRVSGIIENIEIRIFTKETIDYENIIIES